MEKLSGKTDDEIWGVFTKLVKAEIAAAEQMACEHQGHHPFDSGVIYGLKHLNAHLEQRQLGAKVAATTAA